VTLPREVAERISGLTGGIDEEVGVGGGSFGSASRIRAGGQAFFVKWSRSPAAGFHAAEAAGLEALRSADSGIRIPVVLGYGDDPAGWGWLLLEWLDPVAAGGEAWARLGTELARLHRVGTDRGWGWERDGFLGTLPQANGPCPNWATFWAENRLRPQLARASHTPGIGFRAEWDRLFEAIPRLLEPAGDDGPSFLHGDLWSGNVLMTATGPALVDPSFYRGHREVDLAMAALFGGFGPEFRSAYEAEWPLAPGYPAREAVYQLYYLLAHVNLFGATYAAGTASTLRSVLLMT